MLQVRKVRLKEGKRFVPEQTVSKGEKLRPHHSLHFIPLQRKHALNFPKMLGDLLGSRLLQGPTQGDLSARKHAVETLGFGSLTEHGDEGLGSSHGHSEDGASVFTLVCQGHVADADAELMGRRSNQLNPIISKGWGKLGELEARLLLVTFIFIFQSQASFFFFKKGSSVVWGRGKKKKKKKNCS